MKLQGILLIIVAALVPLLWTIPLMGQLGTASMLSQYAGSVSLIWMGITQFLATRVRPIEPIFGSLDRVYGLHKWLGVGSLITAFLHSEIDADGGQIVLVRGLADLAEELGEIGYNGIIILTLASLLTFIPYKWWKWSHRFIGLFFALAALHYFFIPKPYPLIAWPGIYVALFCLLGVGSYLYLLIPRMFGHNTKAYTVSDVIQHNDVTELTLHPQGRGIKHKAGQFAFVNFDAPSLGETHPYTISSAPREDGSLRFLVKGLGSYTKRLSTLTAGTTARVSKAFGHFALRPTKGPQVWIGGGVGITPFMAWSEALSADWQTPTQLYHCVRRRDAALNAAAFDHTAQTIEQFNYELVVSGEGKRLSAETIAANLQGDIADAHIYFCGPAKMRDTLKAGLVQHGLKPANFHFETFEMRSGIGIGFADKLVKRGANAVTGRLKPA